MDAKAINEILGITEGYQLPTRLLSVLLSDEYEAILDRFMSYGESLDHDWFTAYFEAEHANKTNLAQDFTPKSICNIVSHIAGKSDCIADICAGSGGLTIAMWNENPDAKFVCYELSERTVPLLLLNLSLRNIEAVVCRCDILTGEEFEYYSLERSTKYSRVKRLDAMPDVHPSVAVSNPPYSMNYDPKGDTRFEDIKDIIPKGKADYVFVAFALFSLHVKRAVFVLPHGVLFRGSKELKFREMLIERGLLNAVIGLASKLFINTDIPVVILDFEESEDTLFINADKDFTKSKSINVMTDEQVKKVCDAYDNREDVDLFAKIRTRDDLREHDYNLNLPRHCDNTPYHECEIDVVDVARKLHECDTVREQGKNKLEAMLVDLCGTTKESEAERIDALMAYYGATFPSVATFNDKYKTVTKKLTDIVEIERAKSGKTYPAGTVYIQVSATKGQTGILSEPGEIETYNVALLPKIEINPYYLKEVIDMNMDEFRAKFQTGLNIQVGEFKHFEMEIHEDKEAQQDVVNRCNYWDDMTAQSEYYLGVLRQFKEVALDRMMV